MDDRLQQHFYARLTSMRTELIDLQNLAKDDSAPVELDQQSVGRLSRMDAMQRQAMGAEQLRRRQLSLARIDAALDRLHEGGYGSCIDCGEDIAEGRLDADPAAPKCIRCA